jgi:ParB family chromosome partitioning protein
MAKRKALGKGLDALIPRVRPTDDKGRVLQVDIDQIEPSPSQPRRRFGEESLKELADSIRQKGILHPLLVRRLGVGYQLVVGERRWRAAQVAGLRTVPALLHDTDDTDSLELALVENIHREDLNPLEEARAYQMMVERLGLTQEQVASRVGRDRSTVANTLRLLRLHDDVKKSLLDGEIDMGHARAILALDDTIAQRELCKETVRLGLNVRQVERRVRSITGSERARPKPKPDPFIRDAEERLSRSLQARVAIKKGARGGKIEIRFNSESELQRLFDLLAKN